MSDLTSHFDAGTLGGGDIYQPDSVANVHYRPIMFWYPADQPPAPLVDVLLHQVMKGFDDNDPTLIRIGYRNRGGAWVDTYSMRLDGAEDFLEGITHWSPLPDGPHGDIVGIAP